MRTSSKLAVLDPQGRLLLLRCADPGDPSTPVWLELPGGGLEPGEDAVVAGVREVLEETGIAVPPEAVGPLQWTQEASFSWRGARHRQQHEVRLARLAAVPPAAPVVLAEAEVGTILGCDWWSADRLAAHRGRCFPRDLVAVLPRLLAGERVDEPYDDWDVVSST